MDEPADLQAALRANAQLDAQLRYERRQADLLRQVTEAISSELTSARLLPKIIASAASLLGASAGVVSLLADGGTMRFEAVYNLPAAIVGRRVPIGWGLMGRVLATGEPVLLDAEHTLEEGPFPLREVYDSPVWLTVPICAHGACWGAFSLAADPPRRFTARDAEVLALFARHAAIAITNARLYERAQQAAALEERQRLARDLHDSVTQTLFSLQLAAQSAWKAWEAQPERAHQALEMVLRLARGASAEMRTLLFELREAAVESEGLARALEKYVEMIRHRSGLQVELHIEQAQHLPAAYEEALYRVGQEALTNVVKHAHATRASVAIAAGANGASLHVEDDGTGFDAAEPELDSYGLVVMHERVSRLGGTLRLGNRPQGGAYVHAELPPPGEAS